LSNTQGALHLLDRICFEQRQTKVQIVERLEVFDQAARSYSYSILQSPFPVSEYVSTLRVLAAAGGKGSQVIWSGRFTPAGVTDEEVTQLFQGIYEGGLAALADHFAAKNG
jgi:polyketide cyclase/dehydrase/lipid transport protein